MPSTMSGERGGNGHRPPQRSALGHRVGQYLRGAGVVLKQKKRVIRQVRLPRSGNRPCVPSVMPGTR